MRRAERECSNAKARRGPPERPTLTPRATYLSALAEPATSCSGTHTQFTVPSVRWRVAVGWNFVRVPEIALPLMSSRVRGGHCGAESGFQGVRDAQDGARTGMGVGEQVGVGEVERHEVEAW